MIRDYEHVRPRDCVLCNGCGFVWIGYLKKLIECTLCEPQSLPRIRGNDDNFWHSSYGDNSGIVLIYELYHLGRLVYIGQTIDPAARERSHRRDKEFDFMRIVLETTQEFADDSEYGLIHSIHPELNKKCIRGCDYYSLVSLSAP